jgi:predicted ester cyclase
MPRDSTSAMRDLVRRFYGRLWNACDDAAVDDTLAVNVTFRGSLGQRTFGRDEWRMYRDQIRCGAPDFHNEVVDFTADGHRAAARLRYSGTHLGPLLGMAATGRAFSYAGAACFTAGDGLLTDVWVLVTWTACAANSRDRCRKR